MKHAAPHHTHNWALSRWGAVFHSSHLKNFGFGLLICALVCAPMLALIIEALRNFNSSTWRDLLAYTLPNASMNTFIILLFASITGLLYGAGSAIALQFCHIPMRCTLVFLCVLPLAMPTYISSLGLMMLLDQNANIWGAQTLRALLASPFGAGCMFGLSLSPYVFLTCTTYLQRVDLSCINAAYTMGISTPKIARDVLLPLLRPACVGGCALIGMEVLNDVGTVSFLGVTTLTTSAFHMWAAQGQLGTAAQISLIVLVLAFGLLAAERKARKALSFTIDANINAKPLTLKLHTFTHYLFIIPCLVPFLVVFFVPLFVFLRASWGQSLPAFTALATLHSIGLGCGVAVLCCVSAFILLGMRRHAPSRVMSALLRTATSGYGVPGTLIGLGLLLCLPMLRNSWEWLFPTYGDAVVRALLVSSPILVMIALWIRFISVAQAPIEAGIAALSPTLEQAAYTLGASPAHALRTIRLPLLMPAVLSAGLMVGIDSIKELPATLLLHPAGFETLPTLIYAATHREAYEEAAPAALVLIACCLPILFGVLKLVAKR